MWEAVQKEFKARAVTYIVSGCIAVVGLIGFLAVKANYHPVLTKDALAMHNNIDKKFDELAGSYYKDKAQQTTDELFNNDSRIQQYKKRGVKIPNKLKQKCIHSQDRANFFRKKKQQDKLTGYCR